MGVSGLGVYSLGRRDLDPEMHSLGLGVYGMEVQGLGVVLLRVCGLVLELDLV